jgi:hypothetical protein
MAKFCAECGIKLNDTVRFCGSCGTAVLSICPTCGQEWNQIAAKTPTKKEISSTKVETPKSPTETTFAQTSARVQPIYGALFDPGKDCPNCGAKGMGKKSCTLCESEN